MTEVIDLTTTEGMERYNQLKADHGAEVEAATMTPINGLPRRVELYDDTMGWGTWWWFGGWNMPDVIIRADDFGDAYDIYLTEFLEGEDGPEDEIDEQTGTWASNGDWFSESTLSYICASELMEHAESMTVQLFMTIPELTA